MIDRPRREALTDDELEEIERERTLNEMRRARDAFLATFGAPGQRTPHGGIMLEHLERYSRWGKPVYVLDGQGRTDIYRTGIAEGRRQMMQAIHNAIEWRETKHGNTGGKST